MIAIARVIPVPLRWNILMRRRIHCVSGLKAYVYATVYGDVYHGESLYFRHSMVAALVCAAICFNNLFST